MNRAIPLWVFLLCLLLGSLFTMVFGWSIMSTLAGSNLSGRFGDAAVAIASFPTLAKSVFTDLWVDTLDTDEAIRVPGINSDFSEFSRVSSKPGIDVEGLLMRADRAVLKRSAGWRILVGAFTIDGEVKNAALAFSPQLEISKIWVLTEDAIGGEKPRPPHRKFIHGFDILSDGSVIFSFDGGSSLQRFDRCDSRIWAIGGNFHHAVTLDDSEDFVWTLHNREVNKDEKTEDVVYEIVKVATATGEIVQRFSMTDIIEANPRIDILEIRKLDDNDLGGNRRNTTEEWMADRFHLNDVDPLPVDLANRFDDFSAGDLLVSSRSLNLVFVVDPGTLEVKWWRIGAARRQHDPDWGAKGEITVYDNRMSRDYSRIISIMPKSFHAQVLFDGRSNDFYSRIRGKHQITSAGNLIVTSSQQGRVFEVDRDGNVVLEFINNKPGTENTNYAISEAIWLDSDAFDFERDLLCRN